MWAFHSAISFLEAVAAFGAEYFLGESISGTVANWRLPPYYHYYRRNCRAPVVATPPVRRPPSRSGSDACRLWPGLQGRGGPRAHFGNPPPACGCTRAFAEAGRPHAAPLCVTIPAERAGWPLIASSAAPPRRRSHPRDRPLARGQWWRVPRLPPPADAQVGASSHPLSFPGPVETPRGSAENRKVAHLIPRMTLPVARQDALARIGVCSPHFAWFTNSTLCSVSGERERDKQLVDFF